MPEDPEGVDRWGLGPASACTAARVVRYLWNWDMVILLNVAHEICLVGWGLEAFGKGTRGLGLEFEETS